jgi:hypothetical protein
VPTTNAAVGRWLLTASARGVHVTTDQTAAVEHTAEGQTLRDQDCAEGEQNQEPVLPTRLGLDDWSFPHTTQCEADWSRGGLRWM